jgi:hypothetical protein
MLTIGDVCGECCAQWILGTNSAFALDLWKTTLNLDRIRPNYEAHRINILRVQSLRRTKNAFPKTKR